MRIAVTAAAVIVAAPFIALAVEEALNLLIDARIRRSDPAAAYARAARRINNR